MEEEHKFVVKQLKDADKQLVSNLQKIQSLNRDKERKEKELDEMATATHALCKVVDPTVDGRSLVQRLVDTPRSIVGYMLGTAKVVLTHGLALVKLYALTMVMQPLAEGSHEDCSEEQFAAYIDEVRGVAHKIVDDLQLFQE